MTATALTAAPVIKWVGGKGRLLSELTLRMPQTYGRYFEPFAGGAALFFHVAPKRAVLADQNRDLIAFYRALATDPERVIRDVRVHRRAHGTHYYYRMRERWNDPAARWSQASRAAAFLYLNKTCFNGLWRVNRLGEFNVPMGRYKNPAIFESGKIRAAGGLLSRAELRTGDFRVAVADAASGDFIYFDPPYDPVSATANFTKYGVDGFTRDDQAALAATAVTLVERGCHVMLSNHDTRFVRALYRGFHIDRVYCSRSINSNIAKRRAVAEVIITSAGPS